MKIVKEKDVNKFDNGQMLIHFGEIYDEIILNQDDMITVKFYGNVIEVDSDIIKSVITYYKLEKKFKLESECLLDEIIMRMLIECSHISKDYLKEFFNEIYKSFKILKEKNKMKKKIVWLKKDNNQSEDL